VRGTPFVAAGFAALFEVVEGEAHVAQSAAAAIDANS
jgi:hypothetical protein